MNGKILFDSGLSRDPFVSIILLDWCCRESFHSLEYLANQSAKRSQYEILWIEYYERVSPQIKQGLTNPHSRWPLIDKWIVLGMPENVYYHKHLMYNIGIAISKGRVICICDSDAVFSHSFVDTIIASFTENDNIVLHLDEVRNVDRRFYPFNYPTVEEILREGCINWENGKTTGVLDREDPLHSRNYGACMCALREDLIAIGGADEHKDYLGHVCGPYEATFRLVNVGKQEVWHEEEYLYHVWHPGTDGRGNYIGPHDGRNMSTTALKILENGRVMPLEENPVIRGLRLGAGRQLTEEEIVSLTIQGEKIEQWMITEKEYNLALGKEAFSRCDYDEAIRYWRKVLESLPSDGEVLTQVGWAYYLKSNYDEAFGIFKDVLDIDRESVKALSGLAWIYLKRNDFDSAIASFSKVLKLTPEGCKDVLQETFRGRGWALFHKERHGEAQHDFLRALEYTASGDRGVLQDLYRGLGWSYSKSGDSTRSRECFLRALANIHQSSKDIMDDARRGLESASGVVPEAACTLDGDGIDALTFMQLQEQGTAVPPARDNVYYSKPEKNLRALKSDLWCRLGWAYYLGSKYNDAIACFDNALKINAWNYRALDGRGWSLLQKALVSQAIQDFTEAIRWMQLSDKDSLQEVYRGRGWAHLRKGSFPEAMDDFEKALENTDSSNQVVLRELYKGKSIAFFNMGNRKLGIANALLAGDNNSTALIKLYLRSLIMRLKVALRGLLRWG